MNDTEYFNEIKKAFSMNGYGKMSELEEKASEIICHGAGEIMMQPYGKVYSHFLGKNVTHKGYKFTVSFNGRKEIGKTLEGIIIQLHKIGKIDLFSLGYETCPKCSGTGKLSWTNVDNGNCFKCSNMGIIKGK